MEAIVGALGELLAAEDEEWGKVGTLVLDMRRVIGNVLGDEYLGDLTVLEKYAILGESLALLQP